MDETMYASHRRLAFPIVTVGAVVVALLLVRSSGATPSGGCVFSPATGSTTCTFTYTGAPESWTAPPDVGNVTVTAWGGHGGVDSGDPLESGGLGGFVTGSVTIGGGSSLDIIVAQDGGSSYYSAFGGGGASYRGGGGGGASSVSVHGGATLLVAGGGGGSGVAGQCPDRVPGGNGGSAGADGEAGGGCNEGAGSGGGVAGGSSTSTGVGVPQDGSGHEDAGAGGGGYRGGGAGQIRQCVAQFCVLETGAGGGGGGASFVAPFATSTSTGLSNRPYESNGLVTITYSSISEQLSNLLGSIAGVGPSASLVGKATQILAHLWAASSRTHVASRVPSSTR